MARRSPSLGLLCLGVYLILVGLTQVISLHFAGLPVLLGLLAIVAGALLVLNR